MDLFLTRDSVGPDGIFSTLTDENGNVIAVTLEHAYVSGDGTYAAKIPNGIFSCVRGNHQLKGMAAPFATFEITGVTGHKDLLFHAGNYNADSEGCILVGESVASLPSGEMITNSKATFATFMALQAGVTEFSLTVVG